MKQVDAYMLTAAFALISSIIAAFNGHYNAAAILILITVAASFGGWYEENDRLGRVARGEEPPDECDSL